MAAYTIVPIEHNIKQAITAAVKAVEFKKYHVEDDEIVNNLLADIFRSLFPHNPSLVTVDKVEIQIPIVPPAAAEEEKSAAKEKKPRAKKEAGAGAAAASADAAPKKARAKKEKPVGQNLAKVNPSQGKILKKENVDPKLFLEFVNAMTEEEYKAKTFGEHVQNFGKPKVEVVPYVEPLLVETEHNGKTYFVDPDSKKVYVQNGDVDELVGHVGMQEFVGMIVPA